MSDFALVQPYDFMDDLPEARELCFVLGCEYEALFRRARTDHDAWSKYVHSENAERIMTMLERQGRRVLSHAPWSGWVLIHVAASEKGSVDR